MTTADNGHTVPETKGGPMDEELFGKKSRNFNGLNVSPITSQ